MRFLITNDDGIFAPGIRVLIEKLSQLGEIYVVAPNQERSGVGHGITVNRPLRIEKLSLFSNVKESYMMDGTPADCVKLALEAMDLEVDYVVSGINNGANLSTDVFYSGTVSAAIEGALQNIPAIAVSLCHNSGDDKLHYETAANYVLQLLSGSSDVLQQFPLLNINVPNLEEGQARGVKATQLGVGRYKNEFEQRLDPRGKPYYWMKGIPFDPNSHEDDDYLAVHDSYISVTPIKLDMTHHQQLSTLKKMLD